MSRPILRVGLSLWVLGCLSIAVACNTGVFLVDDVRNCEFVHCPAFDTEWCDYYRGDSCGNDAREFYSEACAAQCDEACRGAEAAECLDELVSLYTVSGEPEDMCAAAEALAACTPEFPRMEAPPPSGATTSGGSCGDGFCDAAVGESADCSADCCGDGVCDVGEASAVNPCPEDCK